MLNVNSETYKAISVTLVIVSLMILGTIIFDDPDCYYTTDLFLQYRMCEQ